MSIEIEPIGEGIYRIHSDYCKDSIAITEEEAFELLCQLYDLRNTLFARANGVPPKDTLQGLANAPQVEAKGLDWSALEQQIQPEEGDIYTLEVRAGRFTIHCYDGDEWEQVAAFDATETEALVHPMQFMGESKGHRRYYRPQVEASEPRWKTCSCDTCRYVRSVLETDL